MPTETVSNKTLARFGTNILNRGTEHRDLENSPKFCNKKDSKLAIDSIRESEINFELVQSNISGNPLTAR